MARALAICTTDDCRNLTDRGACTPCRRRRRVDSEARRPSSTERGYDGRWARTREAYLATHPVCEREDCTAIATDVHHLDGEGPLGPLGHDWSNLEALCGTCHKQETAQLQPGGWNAR